MIHLILYLFANSVEVLLTYKEELSIIKHVFFISAPSSAILVQTSSINQLNISVLMDTEEARGPSNLCSEIATIKLNWQGSWSRESNAGVMIRLQLYNIDDLMFIWNSSKHTIRAFDFARRCWIAAAPKKSLIRISPYWIFEFRKWLQ